MEFHKRTVHTSNKVAENGKKVAVSGNFVVVSGNYLAVFDYSFGNNYLLPFRATTVAMLPFRATMLPATIASATICCRYRQLCC